MPNPVQTTAGNNQAGSWNTQFAGHADNVIAGHAITTQGEFHTPLSLNIAGGTLSYELRDADGIVYAKGDASGYDVYSQLGENIVIGYASLTVPSSIPANSVGTRYQLRWRFLLADGTSMYSFDTLTVYPASGQGVPGIEDVVELFGRNVTLAIVTDAKYDNVQVELYYGNNVLVSAVNATNMSTPNAMPEGFQYTYALDTSTLTTSLAKLDPYTVIWTFWNTATPTERYSDSGRLFLVTPSILTAAKSVFDTVAKSYVRLGVTPDADYVTPQVLEYMRQGMDRFNGTGPYTNFDMTDATGGVRDGWIGYSCVFALRAQYLAEGSKAFDFGSQAVTLNVDRTQYFEGLASAMESSLDNRVPPAKHAMIKYGASGGTGNVTSGLPRNGSAAALSIGISPATNLWRRNYPSFARGY